jgi:hypothetical protein
VNTALNSVRFRSNAWTNNNNTDLYFSITGAQQSDNATTGGFDGGVINNPIKLNHEFLELIGEEGTQKFMFHEWGFPESVIPNTFGYTLRDTKTPGTFNRIFGALIKNPFDLSAEGSPGVALTHHLYVCGDFAARGMIDSKEGVFVAHGGPKLLGWGPEGYGNIPGAKRNPMLLIKDDGWTDNVAPDTWETRIMYNDGSPTVPDFKYKWANFATDNLTTQRKVMCRDIVHTNFIGPLMDANTNIETTKIESYTSLLPHSGGKTVKDLGSPTQQWDNLYVKNLHVSGSGGSGANIQKGVNVSTDSNGVANITFPSAFPSGTVPAITVTPVNAAGNSISLVITAQSNTGFSVKATALGSHVHNVNGTTGNVDLTHGHFAQGTTNGVNLQHGHLAQGTTATNGNHSHGVNAASEVTSTTSSHNHNYARAGGSSGDTASAGTHDHTFLNAPTNNALGTHDHTFLNAPTNNALGQHSHTVNINSAAATLTPLQITFNWIAL